ncbi:RNA ligase family protein [Actinoallomurus rhizosphaericola]|uniref:RNA ligase family protein n=1 Tax=Actinoallomurus rhizosphaericola TaxID=2952536 RepID=UPI002093FD98|nr:RNA ligase family protein [Actinoallomurus rhizosphaericola]MCO5998224.1 AAA family ATPase [Actinoallomurus rhizosphaericola]
MRVHYPRTPHLPWSPGATPDDVRAGDLAGFAGREVVVTEKLDGENTTLYPDGLHARSLDSAHHPSRAWVKALHGRIARRIPAGMRVCGENLYARHSIAYRDLESWFYLFSVWDGDHCLDWDATVRFARRLGVPVPAVLWRGVFDERRLRALRLDAERQEGYVVRTADGFGGDEFAHRVAKWVRPGHVRTDEHWMLGPVVENGLSPAAALWQARSGATPGPAALLGAVGMTPGDLPDVGGGGRGDEAALERAEAVVAEVSARLDLLGRSGDERLAGLLAGLFHDADRARLMPRLVASLGVPAARRVADLVGSYPRLYRPFPDEARRAGLTRLAGTADVGVLHAVAAAALTGRDDAEAREQAGWSELHADEAGLLAESPLEPLRAGLRRALAGGPGAVPDRDVLDRCWAEAREAYAAGRIATPEEAVALTWRWRTGAFPRLVVMTGPAGSGKSTFARGLPGVDAVVSLDDLREARGSRADQRANPEILRDGLRRLGALLADGATVVWDATALNRHQRSLVHAVAERHDALTTHAVMLVPGDLLARRNADRAHPVPPDVLAAQLRRFSPPYPGEAHRTWYAGPDGRVEDVAGAIDDAIPADTRSGRADQ